MTTMARVALTLAFALAAAPGCESQGVSELGNPGGAGAKSGAPLRLTVGPEARTFVELASPSIVEVEGDGARSIAWDLALQGREVRTNGGVSGPGNASAFGPLSPPTFLSDTAPEVPLMRQDRAGGAFLDWYHYGGATHELFSRYHVYGLKDGERYFKLQVLGYYAQSSGAPPAPANYHVRYAEVTEGGTGPTRELTGIDATAGGGKADADAPSACLDFDTAEITSLTPAQAREANDWHVCFRRESVSVNGGLSGPRGVTAVDLQRDLTAEETEAEIRARNPESERPAFEKADGDVLRAVEYEADGAVTAFGQRWLEPGSEPLRVSAAVWLLLGADGAQKYLIRFSDLTEDPARASAEVTLEAKAVR